MNKTITAAEFGNPIRSASLTEEEFQRVATRVGTTTGIQLPAHKRQLVTSRLSKRLNQLELPSFAAYLDYLEGPNAEKEMVQFCNAITTNLTSFFRESHHFEHLTTNVLQDNSSAPLRIWSAGCSSGEEPYSIAMTLLDAGILGLKKNTRILATDLDTSVLDRAKLGETLEKQLTGIDKKTRDRYFDNCSPGLYRISKECRDLIVFNYLNLLGDWPIKVEFDYIFCRNVMIYFDKPTQSSLVSRLINQLRPNGVLYFGHSETALGRHPRLRCEGTTIYRKIE